MSGSRYRVAVTGDQAFPDGTTIFGDIGLRRLSSAGLEWSVIAVPNAVLTPAQLDGFDALLMMGGRGITAASLAGTALRHVARFGAGYDAIDVGACTDAGVLLTNAPDAVRVPMAHAALAQLLALAHNLVPKDRLVRTGRWDERVHWPGRGLQDATVGVVGLGNVGTEIVRLLRLLGVSVAGFNRTFRPGVMPLEELAAASDYLVVTVSGNPGTRGLISADILARMRPGAFLINLSRGSVVDEDALISALKNGRLRGAALDVFEHEPLPPDSPLLTMDNVVLTPHSLCWTDGFARAVADSAITAILDVAAGRTPRHAVNPEACKVSS
ncbi:NAD(P)-dependent oxidoreductase [Actinoplanes sp. NPDC051411]|uniref:2-hydroxyacid dehydrogenase n=1 Tax=Actinoplanes sp. NPDC051411 TaxID=3155522 RepID=UPI0034122604